MKPIVIIALAFIAATATTAAAQPKARSQKSSPSRTTAKAKARSASQPAKKPVFFDFTGDNIDGDRIRPDGTTIFGLRTARHGSLIELRGDFLREIVKSGERL